MPKHAFGPSGKTSKGNGHPLMFQFSEADSFAPFPEGGGYPKGFLSRAYALLGVESEDDVLHLCSGSMRRGVTVDIRPEKNPTVVCDARHTPFPDESFRYILCDPPYSEDWAKNLYGTEAHYPKPLDLMKEIGRLLAPGGTAGFLHFQVPFFRHPLKLVKVYGITTGLGFAIRAFSVFEKPLAKKS